MSFLAPGQTHAQRNPHAVTRLLNRIGGKGAAKRFITIVDSTLSTNGNDVFVLSAQQGKPCIKGNSVLAVTTGINWYLNHQARINLTWNNPTANLRKAHLPLPPHEERHECTATYRYYLNYCTFSYSMSTWTWERWEQEIDWMALHGINLPLQIVGLDAVWYNLLTQHLGYTPDEANRFIAGPCFQAWWGMNNLEGWGGPNPEWWYKRQTQLARRITDRQRELGMSPVLPGYSGMIPSNINEKGIPANNQGRWCAFMRPYILNPNTPDFNRIAKIYYQQLTEVMGQSHYYSMDPFHEGANTQGIDVPAAYHRIAQAMLTANPHSKWVIQSWQWSNDQYQVLNQVKHGQLLVLDLFSDAHNHFDRYQGHEAVYCSLPNFGGRTGLFGRLTHTATDYFAQRARHPHIKGIGATPEAIEQVPVLYDALFELPWHTTCPDMKQWLADYTASRYGKPNAQAQAAWELLRNSALQCPSQLQGPHEAVFCARPSLQVDRVSTWGGTHIFYNPHHTARAAQLLLAASDSLDGANYRYDVTDLCRQALTDYGYFLLNGIRQAHSLNDTLAYMHRRDTFLQLMLDLDTLLATQPLFTLGRWTSMARQIADEVRGTTEADRQWLEINNARMLITTWGPREASEQGGLHDYSYRTWAGLMKDFYYPRWKTFFNCIDHNLPQPDWFAIDSTWVHHPQRAYSALAQGNSIEVARRLLRKYFINPTESSQMDYPIFRHISTDATTHLCLYKKLHVPYCIEVAKSLRNAPYGIFEEQKQSDTATNFENHRYWNKNRKMDIGSHIYYFLLNL